MTHGRFIPTTFVLGLWSLVVLVACFGRPSVARLTNPPPTAVPVTSAPGQVVTSQPGPLWVLVSGVDEHGLIQAHNVPLLIVPEAGANFGPLVHSGTAAAVFEIRQTGEQALQRFYRLESISGDAGWISDYYIRRLAYLYNDDGADVTLHDAPDGPEVGRVQNVTPVTILDPLRSDWWQVRTADNGLSGWVESRFVKESPELEFLLNQQHRH